MKEFLSDNKFQFLINFVFILLSSVQCILFIGLDNLNIYNFNWLFHSDAAADVVNWIKFKNSDWFFPLGLYDNAELGKSSLAFTGAVPFLSIFFKFFFKNLDNFQYFGLWIFICFYFQFLFSYLIIFKKTQDLLFSIFASFLFVLSPILFHRFGYHLSLSGHWIILAFFYNKLFYDKKNYQIKSILIICFSSLIHFYFTLMLLWIEILHTFLSYLKKKKIIKDYIKYLFLNLIPLVFIMYVIGYFQIPVQDTLGGGYGIYKMNLLSVINPLGQNIHGIFNWSNFLPLFSSNYGEKEGFSYLGLGSLILFFISLYYFFIDKNLKINSHFCIIILTLIIFSLSNKIDLGSYNLFQINLDKKIEAILSLGRASGRFFWPVYYFIMLFSLVMIHKKFLNKGIYVIIVILIIQIIDIKPGLSNYINSRAFNNEEKILGNKIWDEIKYKDLILSSTYIYNGSSDFYKTLNLNIQNIKSEIINLARYDRKKLISLRYKNYENFYKNTLNNQKIFIINNYGHLNHLKYLFKKSDKHVLLLRDNIWIIADKQNLKKNIKNDRELNKINSKKILLDSKYNPNFKEGIFEETFLGLGWSNHRKDTVSDGKNSSLLFNLSDLSPGKYILQINIVPNILKDGQEILIELNGKEYIFGNRKNENLFFEIDTNNIEDLDNYVVHFKIKGMITEFDVLKSPDLKLIGFKLNYLSLNKI